MLYNIYFSPTGGTLKAADILCQQLRKELGISPSEKAVSVDLMQKTFTAPVLTPADLCVVSVPAYGGRVPEIALQKLKAIPGNGAGAVLVAVYGNRAIDDTLIELQDAQELQAYAAAIAARYPEYHCQEQLPPDAFPACIVWPSAR